MESDPLDVPYLSINDPYLSTNLDSFKAKKYIYTYCGILMYRNNVQDIDINEEVLFNWHTSALFDIDAQDFCCMEKRLKY